MLLAFEVSAVLANAGRLAVLAVPALLGVVVVRARLIGDVPAAIGALNVYTLHIGFPALIALGVLNVGSGVASHWGFWVAIPVVDLVLVGVSRLVGRLLTGDDGVRQGGTIALVLLFGNTAYLGLPFAVSVLGERARGPASLLVAIQVGLAVFLGPVLLQRWSGGSGGTVRWARVLRQPLLWAPLVGVFVRLLPASGRDAASDVLSPLAASTAPVAMFLLGLYLVHNWERVRVAEAGVWTHVGLRLIVAPVVNAAVAVVLLRLDAISGPVAAIIVILGGMPAAISTFSLAEYEGIGADRVASVVVRSSVTSVLTMPVLATLADLLSRR